MQIDRLILPNILHILLQRQIFNIIIMMLKRMLVYRQKNYYRKPLHCIFTWSLDNAYNMLESHTQRVTQGR